MTRHRALNILLGTLTMAAIAVCAPVLMDQPSELDALQATAASVIDAQQQAAAAANAPHLLAQDRP